MPLFGKQTKKIIPRTMTDNELHDDVRVAINNNIDEEQDIRQNTIEDDTKTLSNLVYDLKQITSMLYGRIIELERNVNDGDN